MHKHTQLSPSLLLILVFTPFVCQSGTNFQHIFCFNNSDYHNEKISLLMFFIVLGLFLFPLHPHSRRQHR